MNSCSLTGLALSPLSLVGDDLRVFVRLAVESSIEVSLGVSVEFVSFSELLELGLSELPGSDEYLKLIFVRGGEACEVRDGDKLLSVVVSILIEAE